VRAPSATSVRSHHRSAGSGSVHSARRDRVHRHLDSPPTLPPSLVDIKSVSIANPTPRRGIIWPFTLQVGEQYGCCSADDAVVHHLEPPRSERKRRSKLCSGKTSAAGVVSYEYGTVSPPNQNLPRHAWERRRRKLRSRDGDHPDRDRATLTSTRAAGQTADGRDAPELFPARWTSGHADGLTGFSPAGSVQPRSATNPAGRTPRPFDVVTIARRGVRAADRHARRLRPRPIPMPGTRSRSYQFSFGDGSPGRGPVQPTIDHTYTSSGTSRRVCASPTPGGRAGRTSTQKTTASTRAPSAELGSLTWRPDRRTRSPGRRRGCHRIPRLSRVAGRPSQAAGRQPRFLRALRGSLRSSGPVLTGDPGGGHAVLVI